MADPRHGPRPARIPVRQLQANLMYASSTFFMRCLRDTDGRPFDVPPHAEHWCGLIEAESRLVLLAPRAHGKSTVGIVEILWRFYRHSREPDGRLRSGPLGTFQAVLFSATHDQARVHLDRVRRIIEANPEIFGSVAAQPPVVGGLGARASMSRVRLMSGAELLVRAFGTSIRGLHPNLLLLDDVVSDRNSGSQRGRDEMWRHFAGTILPMHAERILILGTAVHQNDLLLRLRPGRTGRSSAGPADGSRAKTFGFAWRSYRAIDHATQTSLWPARHPYAKLVAIEAEEPVIFAREYQNDPRDDATSLFPHDLTQPAVDAGADLTFVPNYRPRADEFILAGVDLARSEAIGADWTVAIVIAYQPVTGLRQVLTVRRERGLTFDRQIALLTELAESYQVGLGVIEQNGFQHWALDALKVQDVPNVYVGHTTGREKSSLSEGVPALKLPILHKRWVMPSGDPESRRLAKLWQAELSAFGWRGGRLGGIGEHDDLVMATWFVERAIWRVDDLLREPAEEIIYGEDIGIERVRIGDPYE